MQNITEEFNLANVENAAVKFTAEWCGPCKRMAPTIEKLEVEFPSITFLSVDIDKEVSIAQKFKIKAIPSLILLKNGEEVNRVTGLSLIQPLRKMLRDVILEEGMTNLKSEGEENDK